MAASDLSSNNNNSSPPTSRYCCLPILRTDSTTTWWRAILRYDSSDKWWGRGVRAMLKFREWSELVAGPKWKTFIRRFNRSRSGTGSKLRGPFNYDPLSYSLNFDEGPGRQNGQMDAGEYYDGARDFSARYAAVPPAVRGVDREPVIRCQFCAV